jgi:hypothetical protein
MIVTEIGKVQNDRITVRTYDGEDLSSVGIHYAGTIRQGCEYLMDPDMARELARMLTEAADYLEGGADD